MLELRILSGEPTPEELAAVTVVLLGRAAAGGAAGSAPSLWACAARPAARRSWRHSARPGAR